MDKNLKEKLSRVQQRLEAPKSQYNEFGNFNYRSAEDIFEAVKPILAEEGLVLTVSDEMVCIGDRYYVKATATVSDGESEISVSAFAREDESRAGMSDSQLTGCCSSYARKYALNGLFCIDDGKDSDSFDNRATPVNRTQKASNKTSAPKKSNSEQLKDFCSQEKLKEGVDTKVLKKFFEFYSEKADNFEHFSPSKLWDKWQANERK